MKKKKTSYDVWIFPLPSGLEIRLRDVPQEDLDFLDSIEQKTARIAELEAVLRECREALLRAYVHCPLVPKSGVHIYMTLLMDTFLPVKITRDTANHLSIPTGLL